MYPILRYFPALRGVIIHSNFAAHVQGFDSGRGEFWAEQTYKNHRLRTYGVRGGVRADAVYGDRTLPDFVVDLKTGRASVTNAEFRRYREHLPHSARIYEINAP
jgi:hypothetical protein